MRRRHALGYKREAWLILKECGIKIGAEFSELHASHISQLLKVADEKKYQKQMGTNDRARYFHALLQRRAQIKSKDREG